MTWAGVAIGAGTVVGAGINAYSQSNQKVPNAGASTEMQAYYNDQAARTTTNLARYNQIGPGGSSTWHTDPNNPDRWTNQISLNPTEQKIYNTQQQGQLGLANSINTAQNSTTSALNQAINQPRGGTPNFEQNLRNAGRDITDPSSLVRPSIQASGGATNALQDATRKAATTNQTQFNYNSAPDMPTMNEGTRKSVEDALFNRMSSRLDPMYGQKQSALDSQLANQGITQGSDAWKTEQQNLSMDRNDAYQSAMNEAISGGGVEMARDFDLGMEARQQGVTEADSLRNRSFDEANSMANIATNTSNIAGKNLGLENAYETSKLGLGEGLTDAQWGNRSDMLGEQYTGRNQVLNELNSLRTGQQSQLPQFNQTGASGQAQAPDYSGNVWNAYQANQANSNANMNSINGLMSGLGSAASTYFMNKQPTQSSSGWDEA